MVLCEFVTLSLAVFTARFFRLLCLSDITLISFQKASAITQIVIPTMIENAAI
jgi:hypothetical protein